MDLADLLIVDFPSVLKYTRLNAETAGLQVAGFETTEKALTYLKRCPPPELPQAYFIDLGGLQEDFKCHKQIVELARSQGKSNDLYFTTPNPTAARIKFGEEVHIEILNIAGEEGTKRMREIINGLVKQKEKEKEKKKILPR